VVAPPKAAEASISAEEWLRQARVNGEKGSKKGEKPRKLEVRRWSSDPLSQLKAFFLTVAHDRLPPH